MKISMYDERVLIIAETYMDSDKFISCFIRRGILNEKLLKRTKILDTVKQYIKFKDVKGVLILWIRVITETYMFSVNLIIASYSNQKFVHQLFVIW
jgi:hypothetical protein